MSTVDPLASARRCSVAPMMGCTDRHFRYLLRLLSPSSLVYSEMIVSGALIHGHRAHYLARHVQDRPTALQLGGNVPDELARCAEWAEQAGYAEVNLNCGCPSDRVHSGGIGACLMREPELVARCLAAMSSAVSIPATVKCRIGVDDMDGYEAFRRFVDIVSGHCNVFIVHARKAFLHGLSPKENREIPPLHYDYVYRLQQERPDLSLVLNGGIGTLEDTLRLAGDFGGVMLGRKVRDDPWFMHGVERRLFAGTPPAASRMEAALAYLDYMREEHAGGTAIKHMARHMMGLFSGCRGARAFRRTLCEHMYDPDAGVGTVLQALEQIVEDNDCRDAA